MLSEDVKILQCTTVTAGAAGKDDSITGATIDMHGFEGIAFTVPVGTIVTGGLQSFKLQEDSDPAMGTAADLKGSKQTIADSADDKTYFTDVFRPQKRYIRLVIARATQNSTWGAVLAFQYRPKYAAVTHGTNVAGEQAVSPIAGTA